MIISSLMCCMSPRHTLVYCPQVPLLSRVLLLVLTHWLRHKALRENHCRWTPEWKPLLACGAPSFKCCLIYCISQSGCLASAHGTHVQRSTKEICSRGCQRPQNI